MHRFKINLSRIIGSMRTFLVLFLMTLAHLATAQMIISGEIEDTGGRAVELANVLLYTQGDTTDWLEGTVSDSLGRFQFSNVEPGKYTIKVSMVGFLEQFIPVEKLPLENSLLPKIILEWDAQLLMSVQVEGKKEILQKTKTGLVFDAKNALAQEGGTAIDVLRSTPTVFVDGEGGVILRGRAPLILINGRNSKLVNLANIPATSIEKIEILTNPSSSFDAEAENGIINIVLKKGQGNGFNGALAAGVGYGAYGRFNSSLLLNHKKENWNVGFGYDNRIADRTRKATGNRINFNNEDRYLLDQDRNDEREEAIHNLRFLLDYEKEGEVFNFEAIHSMENESNYETLFSTFTDKSGDFYSKNKRFAEEIRKGNVTEFALNYAKNLSRQGQKIAIAAATSFEVSDENTPITSQNLSEENQPIGDPILQRTFFSENSNISSLNIDYFQEAWGGKLKSGYKAIFRFSDNQFGQEDFVDGTYQPVPERTGTQDFFEQVHAFYSEFDKNLQERLDIQLGIRGEYTSNSGEVSNLEMAIENQYFNLFPNLNLGYQVNDSQDLRFIYARRINRPSFGQLNPFTDITDSLTQRTGNPNLRPEISDNFELAHQVEFEKASLVSKLYYRSGKNTILPYTVLLPDGVLLTTLENAGSTETIGFEGILSNDFHTSWKSNLSMALFYQSLDAGNIQTEAVNEVLSWNAKWINDFTLWKNSKLQVIGVYNSPTATLQGRRIAVYNVDMAFQQRIWNDRARIGLIVTDVFNTQENGFIWETDDFNFSRIFKVDSRAILLTFGYTFGTKFRENLMENKFNNN
jgi:outer membrane receptor protein involved in Fe transport